MGREYSYDRPRAVWININGRNDSRHRLSTAAIIAYRIEQCLHEATFTGTIINVWSDPADTADKTAEKQRRA